MADDLKNVILYTDGSCKGNPGPGGWAAILIYGEYKKEMSGGEKETTNNRMEITGAVMGLRALRFPCRVDIYTDSAYLLNAFEKGWIANWRRNGWKTASKEPVKNRELWEEIYELTQKHSVTWHKVKGHANDALNNRCDELAQKAADEQH